MCFLTTRRCTFVSKTPTLKKVHQDRSATISVIVIFFDILWVVHHEFVNQGQTLKSWGKTFSANNLNSGAMATGCFIMTTTNTIVCIHHIQIWLPATFQRRGRRCIWIWNSSWLWAGEISQPRNLVQTLMAPRGWILTRLFLSLFLVLFWALQWLNSWQDSNEFLACLQANMFNIKCYSSQHQHTNIWILLIKNETTRPVRRNYIHKNGLKSKLKFCGKTRQETINKVLNKRTNETSLKRN